jgi:hypothetical protein
MHFLYLSIFIYLFIFLQRVKSELKDVDLIRKTRVTKARKEASMSSQFSKKRGGGGRGRGRGRGGQ